MDTLKLQKLWPDYHSDNVRLALRAIPTDVAICLPDEMLVTTVRSILKTFDEVALIVEKETK